MSIIRLNDVWEMYRIRFVIDGKPSWEQFWALKDINFCVEKGEVLGIIGENGAGKSTVLKLIAGILKPDRGNVEVSGRVSGLLELGAGFQPELTGEENIYLSAGFFGLKPDEIGKIFDEIVDFADLGKFIHAPVKYYSQGMFVRLAFAIAIHINPDILVIDDTLAVGDEFFQKNCVKKIFELKEEGRTIIFVTHDMNMLSRLCKRVLLLKEGRIVKDGPPDEIVPIYNHTVGEKRGVGILEKEPLNIVFNNGRMFINWQNKILTPNCGGHTVFLVKDKWYSSLQADWEVSREGENKLVATGKFYQLALTQVWRLEILDNYEIKWDIEMSPEEPLEIQEGHTNIMLTNEYANWFTALEKGIFPPIEYKDKNLQALLGTAVSTRCIGVEAGGALNEKIPSLIFKQSNSASGISGQILNADYLTNCRVLQYKTLWPQSYSAAQSNRLVYFSGNIIFDNLDIDNYLNNLADESILVNGKSKLIFDNGRCILSYNGINLTTANHIDISIFVKGKRHLSSSAHWAVKKESNKLIAEGRWADLPLVLIWEIDITGGVSYSFKIGLQTDKELDIEEQELRFMCCKDYKYWFSDYGTGDFPDNFLEGHKDMLLRCIPDGAIGLQSPSDKFPPLSLIFSKDLNNFAKISNSDFHDRARILLVEKIEPETNVSFAAGSYPCFKIDINLNEKQQPCTNIVKSPANVLQNRRLKFIFEEGKGRIYCNETELTKKLGLYTALRFNGYWHDSASSAIWKIEEKTSDTLRAVGKWLYLPIIQHWDIRLEEEGLIKFDVKMKVEKEIEVDRLQTNLMLSERYIEWSAGEERGKFSQFKEDLDDDWQRIWSGDSPTRCIGIFKNISNEKYLPPVLFFCHSTNPEWFPNIINSDIYYRGRVLRYSNSEKRILAPDDFFYFTGKIVIETSNASR
jgi:ABC-2 type transport system ATP-binding protein